MFSDALTYPKDGPDAAKTILIGGVLTLLGVFLIPIALVTGYVVRVIRAVNGGDRRPPVFDDWGRLFVDGIKGMAVMLLYFVIPAIVLGIAVTVASLVGSARIGAAVALVGALVTLPSGSRSGTSRRPDSSTSP